MKYIKASPLTVLIVFGVGLVLYQMGLLFKRAAKLTDSAPVDNPIDDLETALTPQKAGALADKLYGAMNYAGGTDEEAIFLILGKITKPDFAAVYNAFGKRNYSRVFGEGGAPVFSDKLDLLQWLSHELTNQELDQLRALNSVMKDYI